MPLHRRTHAERLALVTQTLKRLRIATRITDLDTHPVFTYIRCGGRKKTRVAFATGYRLLQEALGHESGFISVCMLVAGYMLFCPQCAHCRECESRHGPAGKCLFDATSFQSVFDELPKLEHAARRLPP